MTSVGDRSPNTLKSGLSGTHSLPFPPAHQTCAAFLNALSTAPRALGSKLGTYYLAQTTFSFVISCPIGSTMSSPSSLRRGTGSVGRGGGLSRST